jgi:two-component system nitrate/nitrite response regulator NarL
LATNREKAVLQCVAKGLSNKAIAQQLQISDGTVKVHVKHVLRKLNFRSRVEAAVWMADQERSNAYASK